MKDIVSGYFRYWGKAEKSCGCYHLLPYHCLDVTAVAAVWWDASPTIRRSFSCNASCSALQIRAWLLFFVALHDYGKFDMRFQLKVREAWEKLHPLAGQGASLPPQYDVNQYRHGESGLFWFKKDFFAFNGCETTADSLFIEDEPLHWSNWKTWVEAVTGHHGHVKQAEFASDASLPVSVDGRFAENDQTARKEWLKALEQLFLRPAGLSLDDAPPPPSPLLAGFCSVSDWLASRCDDTNFSFHQSPLSISDYFIQKISQDAPAILAFSGLNGTAKSYGGISDLLPAAVTPRPLQTKVEQLPLQDGLTIIEAPTGSGKTEAALAHAWRLLAAGQADSIIFALPTQATANAMLGRLESLAEHLFADSPNILLAHGNARFNRTFTDLKRRGHSDAVDPDGWTQCGEWLAESRKRVFFGQIGVCTIDQVLISVLPVKHRFVRGLGVGRSVLIVDEVHAYDAYMYGLLEEVLRQQRQCGGSVILLSATLPATLKQQLTEAWGDKRTECNPSAAYPLLTWIGNVDFPSISLTRHEMPKPVTVEIEALRLEGMEPDQTLLARIVRAAESGAQVAVICNMVNDAQRIAAALREMTSAPVGLFHARYRFKDRQIRENEVIDCFGPSGKRERGRILVATQVVEQSLDLDFDWLVTPLCPVDLLFQRMGRLHRHLRASRPAGYDKPVCTVLLPCECNYGYTGKIYADTRVLWRTEQLLTSASAGQVTFPAAYREWIESVYSGDPWGNEPESVVTGHEKFEVELEVKRYKAMDMVRRAFEVTPFSDSDENVTAVTRDDEMGLTVIPVIDSPNGRRFLDGGLLGDLDEFRRAEELSLNSINIPARWSGWLKALCEIDDERRYWLTMTEKGEGCYVREGDKVTFRYHRDTGLERVK
ncbi:CRISPR-associated helicase/endonuclease Cas3 [Geobacter benzoatilyticus]|uniref:CRISPR-associated helicase/endonuclease Cas3 n=1 Tax=Geobacter benzoatilyticus TaxID=2815309 RepID=A0ABX7Q0V5_9BACT|nr:CRISPR-associated helicase/endonuclease Cas3 [Geobacter benzoatilyticus]QSV44695.1 CRISPR-associated helicase/endonuclease Cas3 [Geobacter benzoatilyticus]